MTCPGRAWSWTSGLHCWGSPCRRGLVPTSPSLKAHQGQSMSLPSPTIILWTSKLPFMRYSLFSLTFKSTPNFPRTSLLPRAPGFMSGLPFYRISWEIHMQNIPCKVNRFYWWPGVQGIGHITELKLLPPTDTFPSLGLPFHSLPDIQQAAGNFVSGVDPAPEGLSQIQGHRFCRIWDRTFLLLLPEESFKPTVDISYDCDLLLWMSAYRVSLTQRGGVSASCPVPFHPAFPLLLTPW